MNNERAKALADYLSADPVKTAKLFEMDVEDAAKITASEGYDFSVEELTEIAEAIVTADVNSELNEDELDEVAGGVFFTASAVYWGVKLAILGAPYAWKAGKWLGEKVVKRMNKKK